MENVGHVMNTANADVEAASPNRESNEAGKPQMSQMRVGLTIGLVIIVISVSIPFASGRFNSC